MNENAFRVVESRLMHSVLPFLLLGLTTTTVLARHPSASPSQRSRTLPTVLVLGDSLSAGFGLKHAEAYPALLAKKAAASGEEIHLLNAGVSGDTTAGGLRRLPRLLQRHVDVLLIQLGINDLFRGVPSAEIESNLQAIIDQVQIVLAGMQLPGYSNGDNLTAFGALYLELAERNHARLVPFLLEGVVGNPALNLPDLIHPNANGQKVLAANVWPTLEIALRQVSKSQTLLPNE